MGYAEKRLEKHGHKLSPFKSHGKTCPKVDKVQSFSSMFATCTLGDGSNETVAELDNLIASLGRVASGETDYNQTVVDSIRQQLNSSQLAGIVGNIDDVVELKALFEESIKEINS